MNFIRKAAVEPESARTAPTDRSTSPLAMSSLFSSEVWVASLVSRKRSLEIEKFQLRFARSPLRSCGVGPHSSYWGTCA